MGDFERYVSDDAGKLSPAQFDAWLDYLELRRQVLIMELRGVERTLKVNGRLRRESLPTRAK
jgi:hypothetical protein